MIAIRDKGEFDEKYGRLLQAKEVAHKLNISVRYLYQMRHKGTAPPAIRIKPFGLRFPEKWLIEWVEQRIVEPDYLPKHIGRERRI